MHFRYRLDHTSMNDRLKHHIEKILNNLQKYDPINEDTEFNIRLETFQKNKQVSMEVFTNLGSDSYLKASYVGDDFYQTTEVVRKQLEAQIKKMKAKYTSSGKVTKLADILVEKDLMESSQMKAAKKDELADPVSHTFRKIKN